MSNKDTFSKRKGFLSIIEKEITIRDDAPEGLRYYVRRAYLDLQKKPSNLREITTSVLKISPDCNNGTEYPYVDSEVKQHLENCEWYRVYDIIETIIKSLNTQEKTTYSNEINDYFIENGIGWKIENGQIETRGDEQFETTIKNVEAVLEEANITTAKREIKEAIIDLSKRPTPDITGAIQHSMACLECVAREISGDNKKTLGDLIKKHHNIFPKPIDTAVVKLWGFSSEQGRHLQEGNPPKYLEAELVVGISAVTATYLAKKLIETL